MGSTRLDIVDMQKGCIFKAKTLQILSSNYKFLSIQYHMNSYWSTNIFSKLDRDLYQGCQLLRIAWREELKHEKKNNILIFFSSFASACVNLCTGFNFNKRWRAKKKKGYAFLDAWDFTCLAGCFAFMREILHAWHESMRNSVQAWGSRSMRESWQPCFGETYRATQIQKSYQTQHVQFCSKVVQCNM